MEDRAFKSAHHRKYYLQCDVINLVEICLNYRVRILSLYRPSSSVLSPIPAHLENLEKSIKQPCTMPSRGLPNWIFGQIFRNWKWTHYEQKLVPKFSKLLKLETTLQKSRLRKYIWVVFEQEFFSRSKSKHEIFLKLKSKSNFTRIQITSLRSTLLIWKSKNCQQIKYSQF